MKYCFEHDNPVLAKYREQSPVDERARQHIRRSSVLRLREAILAHYEVNPFNLPIVVEGCHATTLRASLSIQLPEQSGLGVVPTVKALPLPDLSVRTLSQVMRLISLFSTDTPVNDKHILQEIGFDSQCLDFQTFVDEVDWNCERLVDCFHRSVRAGEISYAVEGHLHEFIRKEDYVRLFAQKGVPFPKYFTEQVTRWEPPKLETIDDVKAIDFEDLSVTALAALGANVIAQLKRRAPGALEISKVLSSKPMKTFLELVAEIDGKHERALDTIRKYIDHQWAQK